MRAPRALLSAVALVHAGCTGAIMQSGADGAAGEDGGADPDARAVGDAGPDASAIAADAATPAIDASAPPSIDAGTEARGFVDLGVGMGPSAYHACAIEPDGTVVCWGRMQSRAMPPSGLRAVAIASGHSHNCVILPPGEAERVVCFGYGEGIEVPDGLVDPVQVSVGQLVSCVLERDGRVVCWGRDEYRPAAPEDLRAKYVSACGAFACAIALDDTVVCWGANPPELPEPGMRALQVAVAQNEATALGPTERPRHACAVRLDHSVVCWGDDVDGEVSGVPEGLAAREVAIGLGRACAITLDGDVVCWGTAREDLPMPAELRARAIRLHHHNGCALDQSSDTMTCWGPDDRGHASGPDGEAVLVPSVAGG